MQIKFDGIMEINSPVSAASSFLTNMGAVAKCIPDSDGFVQTDETSFTMKIKVAMGLVGGIFELKGTMLEKRADHVAYNMEGRGIGSSVKIMISFDLKDKDGSATEVPWTSTFDLSGLISGVGSTIIKKVSEEKINQVITNVKANIEASVKQNKTA